MSRSLLSQVNASYVAWILCADTFLLAILLALRLLIQAAGAANGPNPDQPSHVLTSINRNQLPTFLWVRESLHEQAVVPYIEVFLADLCAGECSYRADQCLDEDAVCNHYPCNSCGTMRAPNSAALCDRF